MAPPELLSHARLHALRLVNVPSFVTTGFLLKFNYNIFFILIFYFSLIHFSVLYYAALSLMQGEFQEHRQGTRMRQRERGLMGSGPT